VFAVEQLDHVALTVRDVRKSVEWYRDVLGLERRHEGAWGDHPAVMAAGSTAIALFPGEPDPRASLRHVAFRCDRLNFDRAREELSGRGLPFHFEDHTISHSIYFADPDGNRLEITTYEVART
jgi:catechol 2,3-dioxygenase-like lactoylglutathione lyase family enzyme